MTDLHEGEPTDSVIVAEIAAGDDDAVAVLYDRHGGLVYGIARQLLRDSSAAEDVTQEVFLAAWRNAGRYDAARGSVAAWLGTFARNRSIDRLRSERSRNPGGPAFDVDAAFDVASGDDTAATVVDAAVGEQVRAAVRELPERQREVVELAWFGGFTQSELADRLDIPLGTVKTRMFNAMTRLQRSLRRRGIHATQEAGS